MAGARDGDEVKIRLLVDFNFVDVFGSFPSHVGEAVAIGEGGTAGEVLPEAGFESEEAFGVDAELQMGMALAQSWFDQEDEKEKEIRALAQRLLDRTEWD